MNETVMLPLGPLKVSLEGGTVVIVVDTMNKLIPKHQGDRCFIIVYRLGVVIGLF